MMKKTATKPRQSTANSSKSTANSSKSTAYSSKSTANSSKSTAYSSKSTTTTSKGKPKIPPTIQRTLEKAEMKQLESFVKARSAEVDAQIEATRKRLQLSLDEDNSDSKSRIPTDTRQLLEPKTIAVTGNSLLSSNTYPSNKERTTLSRTPVPISSSSIATEHENTIIAKLAQAISEEHLSNFAVLQYFLPTASTTITTKLPLYEIVSVLQIDFLIPVTHHDQTYLLNHFGDASGNIDLPAMLRATGHYTEPDYKSFSQSLRHSTVTSPSAKDDIDSEYPRSSVPTPTERVQRSVTAHQPVSAFEMYHDIIDNTPHNKRAMGEIHSLLTSSEHIPLPSSRADEDDDVLLASLRAEMRREQENITKNTTIDVPKTTAAESPPLPTQETRNSQDIVKPTIAPSPTRFAKHVKDSLYQLSRSAGAEHLTEFPASGSQSLRNSLVSPFPDSYFSLCERRLQFEISNTTRPNETIAQLINKLRSHVSVTSGFISIQHLEQIFVACRIHLSHEELVLLASGFSSGKVDPDSKEAGVNILELCYCIEGMAVIEDKKENKNSIMLEQSLLSIVEKCFDSKPFEKIRSFYDSHVAKAKNRTAPHADIDDSALLHVEKECFELLAKPFRDMHLQTYCSDADFVEAVTSLVSVDDECVRFFLDYYRLRSGGIAYRDFVSDVVDMMLECLPYTSTAPATAAGGLSTLQFEFLHVLLTQLNNMKQSQQISIVLSLYERFYTYSEMEADGFTVLKWFHEFELSRGLKSMFLSWVEENGGSVVLQSGSKTWLEGVLCTLRYSIKWDDSIIFELLKAGGVNNRERKQWVLHLYQALVAHALDACEYPVGEVAKLILYPTNVLHVLREVGVALSVSQEATLLNYLDFLTITEKYMRQEKISTAPSIVHGCYLLLVLVKLQGPWHHQIPNCESVITAALNSTSDVAAVLLHLRQMCVQCESRSKTKNGYISSHDFSLCCHRSKLFVGADFVESLTGALLQLDAVNYMEFISYCVSCLVRTSINSILKNMSHYALIHQLREYISLIAEKKHTTNHISVENFEHLLLQFNIDYTSEELRDVLAMLPLLEQENFVTMTPSSTPVSLASILHLVLLRVDWKAKKDVVHKLKMELGSEQAIMTFFSRCELLHQMEQPSDLSVNVPAVRYVSTSALQLLCQFCEMQVTSKDIEYLANVTSATGKHVNIAALENLFYSDADCSRSTNSEVQFAMEHVRKSLHQTHISLFTGDAWHGSSRYSTTTTSVPATIDQYMNDFKQLCKYFAVANTLAPSKLQQLLALYHISMSDATLQLLPRIAATVNLLPLPPLLQYFTSQSDTIVPTVPDAAPLSTLELFFSGIQFPAHVDAEEYLLEPFEKFQTATATTLSARDFCLALSLLLPPTFTATSEVWKQLVTYYSKGNGVDYALFAEDAVHYHKHTKKNLVKAKSRHPVVQPKQARHTRSQENVSTNRFRGAASSTRLSRTAESTRSTESIRPRTVTFDAPVTSAMTRKTKPNMFTSAMRTKPATQTNAWTKFTTEPKTILPSSPARMHSKGKPPHRYEVM